MTAAFVGCAMQAGLLALTNRASFTTPEQWVMTAIAFVVYMLLGSAVVLGVWALGRYQRVRVGQLRLAQERAEQAVRERE
ncbi:hypothetical protein, partial [Pseudomonas sp. PNPG3]|uniref:hypothetical protein n=1 Tax=Pseudomonas sp. PNPG3 TaxID=2919497 RepID=UPI001FFC434B